MVLHVHVRIYIYIYIYVTIHAEKDHKSANEYLKYSTWRHWHKIPAIFRFLAQKVRIAFLSLVNDFRAAINLHSACDNSLKTAMSTIASPCTDAIRGEICNEFTAYFNTQAAVSVHSQGTEKLHVSWWGSFLSKHHLFVTMRHLQHLCCHPKPAPLSLYLLQSAVLMTFTLTRVEVRIQKLLFWIAVYFVTGYKNSCIYLGNEMD